MRAQQQRQPRACTFPLCVALDPCLQGYFFVTRCPVAISVGAGTAGNGRGGGAGVCSCLEGSFVAFGVSLL